MISYSKDKIKIGFLWCIMQAIIHSRYVRSNDAVSTCINFGGWKPPHPIN